MATATIPNIIGGDTLKGQQYLAPDLAAAAESDAVVQQLRGVHDYYRNGFDAIQGALKSPDPTRTAEAHFLEVKAKADRWINDCAQRGQSAGATARSTVESLDRDITRSLGIAEGTYSHEIRAHFLKLEKNDRITAARDAIEKFDKDTMAAILSARPYLSGFSDDEAALFKRLYAEKHAPAELKRKAVLEKAVAINSRAFDEALIALSAMFPKDRVTDIQNRIEMAQAAKNNILAS